MGYLDGFGVIIKKWVGVKTPSGARVTAEYPEEVRPKPERFHGRHVLNRYEDGMEKCIGCELCAGVCPAKCIYVRGADNDPEDPTSPGERFGYVYEINYLRCIHCDLCVEACPTEAITETKLFEFSFTNRADAIYTKNELLVGDDGRPRQLPWENWDGGFDPARDTSGWMRATSPGGDADFKGIVAWAGELGYGVRPPERATVLEEVGAVPSGSPVHEHALDHVEGQDPHPSSPAEVDEEPVALDRLDTPPEAAPEVAKADVIEAPVIDAPADSGFDPLDSSSLPDLPPIDPAALAERKSNFTLPAADSAASARTRSVLSPEDQLRPAKFDAVENPDSEGEDPAATAGEHAGTEAFEASPGDAEATGPDGEPQLGPTSTVPDSVGADGADEVADEGAEAATGEGAEDPASDDTEGVEEHPPGSRAGYFDAPDEDTVQKKRRFFR